MLQRHSNGGVIAVWAPSGLGYPKDHAGLLEAFYTAVFTDQPQTIGSATTAAKLAIFDKGQQQRELVDSYILFGDPALRLGGGPSVQVRAAILSAK